MEGYTKKLNRFVCLWRVKGQKKHFLKYRFFRYFYRNREISKIFEFRKKWGQKKSRSRSKKDIFLDIGFFDISIEIGKFPKFLT